MNITNFFLAKLKVLEDFIKFQNGEQNIWLRF